jgi:thiol-disulfide isomerase/thioredoxin
MSRRVRDVAVALTCLLAPGGTVAAGDLSIGDHAPPLAVARWIKGEPIQRLEPGRIYVVEFSATYCGPCIEVAPHLSSLQERYPNVTIISVMASEMEIAKVGPFIAKMGDRVRYRVALDKVPDGEPPDQGAMHRTWMAAAGSNLLGTSFVVDKDGRIAWIGLAKELDEPLQRVVSGTWNVARAAKARQEALIREAKVEAVKKESSDLVIRKKDYDGALALIDRAIAGLSPPDEALIAWRRHIVLCMKSYKLNEEVDRDLKRGDRVAARAAIDRATSEAPEDRELQGIRISFLIEIGEKREACDEIESALKSAAAKKDSEEVFEIVDDLLVPDFPDLGERGRAIILRGARILDDMSKGEDPTCLDILARAYFLNGQADQARRYEEKAVALPGGDDPKFAQRLQKYREAAESSAKR